MCRRQVLLGGKILAICRIGVRDEMCKDGKDASRLSNIPRLVISEMHTGGKSSKVISHPVGFVEMA